MTNEKRYVVKVVARRYANSPESLCAIVDTLTGAEIERTVGKSRVEAIVRKMNEQAAK